MEEEGGGRRGRVGPLRISIGRRGGERGVHAEDRLRGGRPRQGRRTQGQRSRKDGGPLRAVQVQGVLQAVLHGQGLPQDQVRKPLLKERARPRFRRQRQQSTHHRFFLLRSVA